jgi:Family of unknown function (DUF6188)
MYGLPANFNGSFLVGRILEQICFTENQISLNFDQDIAITLEGEYEHHDTSSVAADTRLRVPACSATLTRLIGESVVEMATSEGRNLMLTFSNGHRVTCLDIPNYESYQIRRGDDVVIV